MFDPTFVMTFLLLTYSEILTFFRDFIKRDFHFGGVRIIILAVRVIFVPAVHGLSFRRCADFYFRNAPEEFRTFIPANGEML